MAIGRIFIIQFSILLFILTFFSSKLLRLVNLHKSNTIVANSTVVDVNVNNRSNIIISSGKINDFNVAKKIISPEEVNFIDMNINIKRDEIFCSENIVNEYSKIPLIAEEQLQFCKAGKTQYNVEVGKSWGNLPHYLQQKWDDYNCNSLLTVGKFLSCDELWGKQYFNNWVDEKNLRIIISNIDSPKLSNVKCGFSHKNSIFCKMQNVRIDFSKSSINDKSRSFTNGFLSTYGIENEKVNYGAPGTSHINSDQIHLNWMEKEECDFIETTPTFLTSNDDNFNLAHYMNDVMDTWTLIALSGRNSSECNLLNMDGYRYEGPGGGNKHRLMLVHDPDNHGPFINYYESWFAKLLKAKNYNDKKVCFSELYLPVYPSMSFYWFGWGWKPPIFCSLTGPSPIFQSFNYFLRQKWGQVYGHDSLKFPTTDDITILLEVRPYNPNKSGTASICRVFQNPNEIFQTLNSIPGVKVIRHNLAEVPFKRQVEIVHSAGIYISMHGAGTAQISNMALGSPNCCALIELSPDPSYQFTNANGNFARLLGLRYFSYQANISDTNSSGTLIDIKKLKDIVLDAITTIKTSPTCVNGARLKV